MNHPTMKRQNIKTIEDLKPIVLSAEQQTAIKAGGGGATSGARLPPGGQD